MIKNALNHYEIAKLGKIPFRIYQPTIPDIDKMGFKLESDDTKLALLSVLNDEAIHTISTAVTLKCPKLKRLVYRYIKKYATWKQIKDAFVVLHNVVYGTALFKSCNLDDVISKTVADVAGGRTLIGQIPSFAEYLNFTKEDVLTTPYPILLLMCADKQRVLNDDDVVRVKMSGKDLMKLKNK